MIATRRFLTPELLTPDPPTPDPRLLIPGSARDPLRHALERVGAGGGVGADMGVAGAVGGKRKPAELAHGGVGTIEFMIGAGIGDQRRAGAAPARARHHLLAG